MATRSSTGLPETSINRIREHPKNPRVLVLAHERGVHVSNDGGATWHSLATNMPTVSVDDAIFQERDNALVVGTHGRGIWVLDDVGPLEALTSDVDGRRGDAAADQSCAAHEHVLAAGVVRPRRVLRAESRVERGDRSTTSATGRADRPSVVVTDTSGKVVRTLKGPAAKGVNRVVWDLRSMPPVDSSNVPAGGGRGGGGGGGGRGGPPAAVAVGFPAGGEGGGGAARKCRRTARPAGLLLGARRRSGHQRADDSNSRWSKPIRSPSSSSPIARRVRPSCSRIYEWTKTLGEARLAARALTSQRDSIKADLLAIGKTDAAQADSLNARIGRVASEHRSRIYRGERSARTD